MNISQRRMGMPMAAVPNLISVFRMNGLGPLGPGGDGSRVSVAAGVSDMRGRRRTEVAHGGGPGRYPTEPAIARLKCCDGFEEIVFAEVRPETIGEVQLGVRSAPQEEVRDALLTAGADEEVDVPDRHGRQS